MNAPKPHAGEDWLDHLLREDAQRHIDDSGFADRVLSALPPRRQPLRIFARHLIPVVMTGIAAALVFLVLPGSDLFLDGVADLMVLDVTSPRSVAMLGTIFVFCWLAISSAIGER